MFIVFVGASDIGDCIVRTETCERIYVTVSIIAAKISVVEPQHALNAEVVLQSAFNLLFRECAVSVFRQKTFACYKQSAASVAFDRAAFENKILIVAVFPPEKSFII